MLTLSIKWAIKKALTVIASGVEWCLDTLLSLEDGVSGQTSKKPYGTGERTQMGDHTARQLREATRLRARQLKDTEKKIIDHEWDDAKGRCKAERAGIACASARRREKNAAASCASARRREKNAAALIESRYTLQKTLHTIEEGTPRGPPGMIKV